LIVTELSREHQTLWAEAQGNYHSPAGCVEEQVESWHETVRPLENKCRAGPVFTGRELCVRWLRIAKSPRRAGKRYFKNRKSRSSMKEARGSATHARSGDRLVVQHSNKAASPGFQPTSICTSAPGARGYALPTTAKQGAVQERDPVADGKSLAHV